jgi:elongation factor 1-gamma
MTIKVYGAKNDPQTWKILVAAKLNGVAVETPEFNAETDTKSQDFQKKSPFGKAPLAETSEGTIWGANAIARFVARQGNNKLYGANAFEAAQVEQWIEYSTSDLDLPAAVWVLPILGVIPNNSNAVQKAKGDVRKALENLNKHFLNRTFLVGNRISLADVVVAASLYRLYELVLETPFRKAFVNVNRWFTTVVNQPEFKAVAGEPKLCEKMQVAKESKEEKVEEKKPEPKKEAAPKKEAPKKKKDEEEEEEDELAQEEKPKGPNPLDLLPPSKFVLDEWKRVYSNEDTRTKAIPWFWENLDKEGYSIWFGEYKYNHELAKLYMTANLVGGFLQRLEKLRKYGFGSILILGQEPELKISCVFLVRGSELPAEMKECDDSEHYVWTKVTELENADVKEKVNQYFAWDYPSFNQGKVFK